MVWGLISCNGPERLVWLNESPGTKLNAEGYMEILEDHVV